MRLGEPKDSGPSIDTDPPSQELTALECTGNRTSGSGVREAYYLLKWLLTSAVKARVVRGQADTVSSCRDPYVGASKPPALLRLRPANARGRG